MNKTGSFNPAPIFVAFSLGITLGCGFSAIAADDFKKVCSDAQALYAARNFPEAEVKYKEALHSPTIQNLPRLAIVLWSNLGAAYREDHKLADAERCFKQALALADARGLTASRPASTAMQQYAVLLRKLNRNFEAGEMESRAMGGRPNAPLVVLKPDPDKPGEQIAVFQSAMPNDSGESASAPMPPPAARPIAASKPTLDSKVAATLDDLRKQTLERPNSAAVWLTLASKAGEAGEYETAVTAYKTVIQRWPQLAKQCHKAITFCLVRSGQYSDAQEECKRSIEADPKDPQSYVVLASICSNLGDLDGQIDALHQFTDRFPTDSRYAYVKGELDHLQEEQNKLSQGQPDENARGAKKLTWSLANMPLKVYLKDPYQEVAWSKDKGDPPESSVLQLVQRSLDSWTSASGGKITFLLVDNFDRCNIAVIPVADTQGLEAEYQAGVTDYPREGVQIRARVRIALNDGNGGAISKRRFLETAVHELGHAIGLQHSSVISDVMYPQQRSMPILEPSAHDGEVLRHLYQGRSM